MGVLLALWGLELVTKLAPRTELPIEIDREVVDEMSGERFVFTERLDLHSDYVYDLDFADVDARTRGLAEVCLVIFNSNEFLYVD